MAKITVFPDIDSLSRGAADFIAAAAVRALAARGRFTAGPVRRQHAETGVCPPGNAGVSGPPGLAQGADFLRGRTLCAA